MVQPIPGVFVPPVPPMPPEKKPRHGEFWVVEFCNSMGKTVRDVAVVVGATDSELYFCTADEEPVDDTRLRFIRKLNLYE